MIQSGQMLEWGKYRGNFYGTRKPLPSEIDPERSVERRATFRVRLIADVLLRLLTVDSL
jgi:hypothetical protein